MKDFFIFFYLSEDRNKFIPEEEKGFLHTMHLTHQ